MYCPSHISLVCTYIHPQIPLVHLLQHISISRSLCYTPPHYTNKWRSQAPPLSKSITSPSTSFPSLAISDRRRSRSTSGRRFLTPVSSPEHPSPLTFPL
ncbi:hypothetical protein HanPSC8_Chr01g0039331 [Helianthus annuus]|nr:hypothetical protein HanPSC8_Chr01g0039331 [Helianthus annuus]